MKKYVLPTYSVSISFPEGASLPDETFPVTIEALYTFGEEVQGEAVVNFYSNQWGPRRNLFTKTVQIDSKFSTFDINIAKDLGITFQTTVNAEVVFTETLTGKSVSAIGAVYIAQYGYELFIIGSDEFLPNTPYNLTAAMRKIGTGVPVSYR